MRKYFSIFIFCSCFLGARATSAQDTALFKYLPLKVNNLWVYYGTGSSPMGYGTWYDKYKLTSTTQFNGKTYFTVQHTRVVISIYGNPEIQPIRVFSGNLPIRVDSANLNIYKSTNCGPYNVLLVDSLKAKKNDTSSTCDFHGNRVICSDTSLINIFNAARHSKRYEIHAFEGSNTQTYVKDIGVAAFYWNQLQGSCFINLRGCFIDGVLYGDTSIVGVKLISSEVPSKFSLHQNYPNPFNPVTRIKFDIPANVKSETAKVMLVIYNVLGREVSTLINEQLKPGSYEVEWNPEKSGQAGVSSGVYFYKLIAADYSEIRKMVLIK